MGTILVKPMAEGFPLPTLKEQKLWVICPPITIKKDRSKSLQTSRNSLNVFGGILCTLIRLIQNEEIGLTKRPLGK
jgi:hypothetical protein